MTALGTFEPHTPAWHEARRTRLGGSEIAAACGWSPYLTRDALLQRKAHGDDSGQTKAQERGTMLEPAILAWAAHRLGLTIDPARSAATYVHPDRDWQLYNPDAICTDGTVIEAKTTSDRRVVTDEETRLAARVTDMLYGRAGTDRVPMAYLAQCVWGMGVLGADRCVLAVLHAATNGRPDLALSLYRIPANPHLFARLTRLGERFMADLTATLTKEHAA